MLGIVATAIGWCFLKRSDSSIEEGGWGFDASLKIFLLGIIVLVLSVLLFLGIIPVKT